MTQTILYDYFRSSTSVRVRIALSLKQIKYDQRSVHLLNAEQRSAEYLARNPHGLVPTLVLEDGTALTQSLAIMEYLDEVCPEPPLLPSDSKSKARVRALAYAIACEIHPLNNLRVLNYIRKHHGTDQQAVAAWFRHWVVETFAPLEVSLSQSSETGRFCHGDTPTIADICLFAQVVNNRRFDIDITPYPTIGGIFEQCLAFSAFATAVPPHRPDTAQKGGGARNAHGSSE